MRIAICTWFPRDPSAPHGGVEAVSVNLTRALARQLGTEIHVVTFDAEIREPATAVWGGANIHRLPMDSGSLLGFATGRGRKMLQDFLRALNPDVVHAHDTYGIMTRGLNLPRVFTIHGFIHEDTRYKGGWKARVRSELWKREESPTWKEQPHVISISPYVRERLRGIASGTIHDIENPIDEACFEVPRREIANRVFCAAVICSRKNQLGLARAVAELPHAINAELRLAGPIVEPDYGRRLEEFIRGLGLSGRIKVLGSLPGPQVREELSAAAAFALVSLEEGAPMGIAEAMAAGVPIVTSNRCGMPYMVRHGETGFLVDPLNSTDISTHLAELLADEPLRLRMGLAAKAFALERFHPDRVAERTLRVYGRALADRKPPTPNLDHA